MNPWAAIACVHPRPPRLPSPNSPRQTGGGGRKESLEIAAKLLEIDLIRINGELIGTHRQTSVSSQFPRIPKRGIVNRRPQIDDIVWGRRAA